MSESGYRPTADELLGHADFIRFLARRLVRDDALADDAVQDAFVQAIENPPQGPSTLRAWLSRVVRNASLMRIRGEGRRRGRERAAARPERLSSPAEAAERIEIQRRVIEAVQGLEEPYRSVVVHRFFEGLTVAEIAALGESPEDTVRTRIRRALARLRERLDDAHGGDRRAWTVALLPIAGLAEAGGAAAVGASTVLAGGMLMGGKKIALVAAAVALVAVWFGVSGLLSGGAARGPAAPADGPPDVPAATLAALDSPAAPYGRAGTIAGTVSRGGEPASARIEAYLQAELDPHGMVGRYPAPFYRDARVLDHPGPTGPPVATTEAGSDGGFRVKGVVPGVYRVVARSGDGGTAAAFTQVLCGGHEAGVKLALPTGTESLSARAVWEDGTPFRGHVSAVPPGAAPNASPFSARTGPDGRFVLRGLPRGTVDLTFVQKGGIRADIRGVRVPLGREAEFVVDYDLRPVTGRVRATDGTPIPGAQVSIRSRRRGDSRVLSRAEAGKDGAFRLLAAGENSRARVRAAGFVPREIRIGTGPALDVRLEPSPRLSGRVVRADGGEPVAGIPVYVRAVAEHGGQVHTVTDAEGRFEFGDVPALEIMAFAHGAGLVSDRLAEVRAGGRNPLAFTLAAGEKRELELRVVPAASARGRVVEKNGEGVAGAVVHARIDLRYPTNWFPITSLGIARAATDREGRFVLDTLLPGVRYRFEALPDLRIPVKAGPLTAVPDVPLDVDLVLDPFRRLVIAVRDAETGEPVPGVSLTCIAWNEDGGGSGFGREPVTGPDGTADASPVPAGRIGVMASHPAYASEYRFRDVPGSDGPSADLSFEIRLDRGLEISGRILGPDGTPLAEGTVHPTWMGPTRGGPAPPYAGADLGKDGSFALRRLPPGDYRLSVRRPDGRIQEIPTVLKAGSRDHVLRVPDLRPPLTPLLRLLDPRGRPVPSGEAWFRAPVRNTCTTGVGTVENGTARPHQELRGKGSRWIEIHPTTDVDGAGLGGTLAGPFAADLDTVEVRLAPAVAIEGTVVGPDGRPLRGARLSAFIDPPGPWGDGLWKKAHASALADERGRFRLEGLSAIDWRIETKPPEGYRSPAGLTARGGATGVVVQLEAGVSPTVTVLGGEDRPVKDALVSVRPVDGGNAERVEHRSAADGRVHFEGLDPARRYRLEVRLFSNVTDLFPETIDEWKPADTTVRLRVAQSIAGRVVDPRGDPALGAKVQVWPDGADGGRFADHQVDEDGRFVIGRLPAGTVRVRVRPAGGFSGSTEWRRIETGARDLRLATELRHVLEVEVAGWSAGQRPPDVSVLPDGGKYQAPERHHWHRGPTARYFGLVPGRTYSVLLRSRDRKKCAWKRGIAADAGKVKIEFRPTARVSGRVIVPKGMELQAVEVVWGGHHLFSGTEGADDTFLIEGVPDDAFRIRAIGYLGDERCEAEIDARPGDEHELRLERPEPK